MNIITLNRVLLNNTPLNYRRKRILTEKDFYFKTIERTFTFSKSAGGKSIKDGRAYIKRIKGNSVVWNQLWNKTDYSFNNATVSKTNNVYKLTVSKESIGVGNVFSGTNSIPAIEGHKYICVANISNTLNIVPKFGISSAFNVNEVVTAPKSTNMYIYPFGTSGTATIGDEATINGEIRIIDLTKMFQAGNEPTTIEDFNARVATLGVDMNAYNEGQVIHCNTESIKSVGDNAWDEQWENGTFNTTTGENITKEGQIRSKNLIKVLPNTSYYVKVDNSSGMWVMFLNDKQEVIAPPTFGGNRSGNCINVKSIVPSFNTPTNASYLRFYCTEDYGSTYNHDICIRLAHTGYKTDYEPYWQDILPLPIIRKYFPDGMKKAGSAHDEIRYNKATQKWEKVQRIGSVDMGTLNWTLQSFGFGLPVEQVRAINMAFGGSMKSSNCLCNRYSPAPTYNLSNLDKVMRMPIKNAYDEVFTIKDTSYTDVVAFKADMAGVMLYYELAEPIVTELDAEDQNFRDYYNVADFGTEQSQSSVPSAALLADVGYYFKKSEVKELTLN